MGKPKAINDRLMTVRLPLTKKRRATLISVYAPTMQYSDEDKEKFYSELKAAIDDVPNADKHIILGDLMPGLVATGLHGKASWGDMVLASVIQTDNSFLSCAWPVI